MSTAREASIEWVKRTLSEHAGATEAVAAERAPRLVAIAEENAIPIEDLVRWIARPAPRKTWTAEAFRPFAESIARVRRELAGVIQEGEWTKLCPSCAEHIAHCVAGVWRCPKCGRVN